jgi:hypothetical protein
MDPIDPRISAWTLRESEKNLPDTFLLSLVALSRQGRPGEILRISLPLDLVRRALSVPEISRGPLNLQFQSPEVRSALERLAISDEGDLSLLIAKRENVLIWTFTGRSGMARTFSSPLVDREQIPILLKNAYPADGGQGPWMSVPLNGPSGQEKDPGIIRGPQGPPPSDLRSGGPVVAFPSWVPGKTVEFSVRWSDGRPEENELPEHEKNGRSGAGSGKISFSLDIPWPSPVEERSRHGADSGPATRMIRLLGLFDRAGTMTLTARNAPESFRAHLESLYDSLSRSLLTYPGISLQITFQGPGPIERGPA